MDVDGGLTGLKDVEESDSIIELLDVTWLFDVAYSLEVVSSFKAVWSLEIV